MTPDRHLAVPLAMTLIFVALCFTVSWLFVGLAAGSALVGVEYAWKNTPFGAYMRRRPPPNS